HAEDSRDLDVFEESPHGDVLVPGEPGGQPELGERSVHQIAQPDQAVLEYVAGTAPDADATGANGIEREHGAGEQGTQLVSERAQVLVGATGALDQDVELALARVLGDGLGDRVVETAVERTELLGAERRVAFDRELGDRLTDIAVVVNYLRDGEPAAQQVPPVLDRSRGGS